MLQNHIEALREARKNGESGFTLIELLIVIIVLGILAGIVVFGVGSFRKDAQTAACKADVKTVNVASDAWSAKHPTGAVGAITDFVTAGYLETNPSTTAQPITYDSVTKEWASSACP